MEKPYTTHEVAQMARVHRDTLLRWLREGRVREPQRDRNGWRAFTASEAQSVVNYAQSCPAQAPAPATLLREDAPIYATNALATLRELDWDFADAQTGYLTHSLHPYPAKFIPQIPNALIQELSSVGDTVLDPFCGSGTTLVEALLLKRHAIGIDANPLACLIARAKTTRLQPEDLEVLRSLSARAEALAEQHSSGALPLFADAGTSDGSARPPHFDGLEFWFAPHVIKELSLAKALCLGIKYDSVRDVALTAFSSIVVAVSRQDSDTRYVRREKHLRPGDTLHRFARALASALNQVSDLTSAMESRFTCRVLHANVLDTPEIGPVDLVVCSPPYPNAYSYHLYHRTRMLWLEMDQPTFKQAEIGSHRKYSRKGNGAADAATFRAELTRILNWLGGRLRPDGYASFVIGDSILKGTVVHNDQLLAEVAAECSYIVEANLTRRLSDNRKSFNPAIGRVKEEHIVILRKRNKHV